MSISYSAKQGEDVSGRQNGRKRKLTFTRILQKYTTEEYNTGKYRKCRN